MSDRQAGADTLTLDRFEPEPEPLDFTDRRVLLGAYVDCETTGLDPKRDGIIELSVVPFQFTDGGKIVRYGEASSWLHQCGVRISNEITRITGITNEDVEGKLIDREAVASIVSECALVISHNAKFDRPFCEKHVPIFAEARWGCSYLDIPWRDHYASGNLEFLLFKHCKMFIDAHRASTDAYGGVHLLASPFFDTTGKFAEETTPLAFVLNRMRERWWRVYASRSPFHLKDTLKARGYKWNDGDNGRPKAWHKDVSDDQLPEEIAWLKREADCGSPDLRILRAQDRFTDRA